MKLRIFKDTCDRAGIPVEVYGKAFPSMFKGIASDHYYFGMNSTPGVSLTLSFKEIVSINLEPLRNFPTDLRDVRYNTVDRRFRYNTDRGASYGNRDGNRGGSRGRPYGKDRDFYRNKGRPKDGGYGRDRKKKEERDKAKERFKAENVRRFNGNYGKSFENKFRQYVVDIEGSEDDYMTGIFI
ncbi:hypothetical protein VTL71DRAFT_10851 [Oculimacula yallundae]|uniref:Uncharacterized protein n=1 Tax=Oculimacula yallundae TaxID=86028 RepID=A0ABR4CUK2_9HELO